jgi:DnaJ family protein C protein 3
MKKHCPVVLGLTQIGGENDEWAIVGLGEIAMKEERWEEAVRHFRNAFEKGGRNNRDVRCPSIEWRLMAAYN